MFTLYAKKNYDMPTPGQVDRSMTIAALRVAQGCQQNLTAQPMRRDVLTFLMSKSAVNYWLNGRHWLEKNPNNPKWLQLTTAGLAQVINNLGGGGTLPAGESSVQDWMAQMESGGSWTDDGPREFEGELVPVVESGGRRTESGAKSLMVAHYQAHKSLYPASIKSPASRQLLIELLMGGMEVEDAFSAVVAQLQHSRSSAD